MKVKTSIGTLKAKKDVLNDISIALREAEQHYKAEGYTGLAERYGKCAQEIYAALDEVGFYNDVKEEVQ